MNDVRVYCIIVTYNAMKWIDKCLASLRTSSIKVLPVIIDNCSTDESVDYITTNYPEAHLILNKKNKGFGQANNQGIEYAYKQGASHFFLLNQDAWILSDTIEKLIYIQDKYNIELVSPIHLNGTGDLLDFNNLNYLVIQDYNIEFVTDLILKNLKPYYTISNINAAAWMISKRTIEQIGGFDPVFFHYGEDENYCNRVKFHNGKIAFVPDSFIYHDRLKFGNLEVFNKYSTYTSLLSLYANINNRFWSTIKMSVIIHLKHLISAVKMLLKFDIKSFNSILLGYFTFIARIPKINRNMKKNKISGSNWLMINS